MRKVYIYVTVAMTLSAAILLWNSLFRAVTAAHDEEEHLFVWAGDQARANADFLAVINFDRHSKNYGEVITTFPLPNPGASGNEPHHVGLSRDGRVLGVLKGHASPVESVTVSPDGTRIAS